MIHMYFTDEQCKIDGKTSHNYEVHILPLQTTVFLHFFHDVLFSVFSSKLSHKFQIKIRRIEME